MTHPELIRQAIAEYTRPGDLVIDPMCGSGDVLLEAIKADRMAIGVESEKYQADFARRRIEAATDTIQPSGHGAVIHGNPLHIAELVGRDAHHRAALVFVHRSASEDLTIVLDECRSLLRPDGRLVIVDVA